VGCAIVLAKPAGAHTRRLWFLYEWLTGETLDLPDSDKIRAMPLVDTELLHHGHRPHGGWWLDAGLTESVLPICWPPCCTGCDFRDRASCRSRKITSVMSITLPVSLKSLVAVARAARQCL
jgi:hypothetical protein